MSPNQQGNVGEALRSAANTVSEATKGISEGLQHDDAANIEDVAGKSRNTAVEKHRRLL
jgi:hypothetical protein